MSKMSFIANVSTKDEPNGVRWVGRGQHRDLCNSERNCRERNRLVEVGEDILEERRVAVI
jgi:hypothetical protein